MLKISWKGVNILPLIMAAIGIARKTMRRVNPMDKKDIEALAEKIVTDLGDLKAEAKEIKGVKDALKIIPDVIKKVEELSGGVVLAGAQKKELAVAILNKLVDIPWMPEAAEGMLISLAIDAAVTALNRLIGTAWLAKIA